jgi:hypothetical protein
MSGDIWAMAGPNILPRSSLRDLVSGPSSTSAAQHCSYCSLGTELGTGRCDEDNPHNFLSLLCHPSLMILECVVDSGSEDGHVGLAGGTPKTNIRWV